MPPCSLRATTLLALALGCVSCGSDQKQTTAPNDAATGETPFSSDAGTTTPTEQPAGTDSSSPSGASQQRPDNTVAMSPAPAPAPAAPLTQAQVAMITDLANSGEIEQGKLAEGKAKSPRVKKFAQMMVKHHGEAKADQAKLYKELKLTPTPSPESNALKAGAEQTLGSLRGADGAAFDVAYMNAQVDEHQKVLDTIDRQLLPAATEEKLIDELKKMRETVASHLQEAKAIQAELNKTPAR